MKKLIHSGIDKWKKTKKNIYTGWRMKMKLFWKIKDWNCIKWNFMTNNSSISNNIILISFEKIVITHLYKCEMTGLALSLDQKIKFNNIFVDFMVFITSFLCWKMCVFNHKNLLKNNVALSKVISIFYLSIFFFIKTINSYK